MELLDAIRQRRSIRAFKPDKVSAETITEILRNAVRAPSGVNSQPWEFFVAMGEPLEEVKRAYVAEYRSGIKPHPDITIPKVGHVAPKLQGVYKAREVRVAKQIFEVMGITKEDKARLEAYHVDMYRFFGAPVVVVVVFDTMLSGGWPILDCGIIVQTIALCAQEYGLGTCVMRAIVDYPDKLRTLLAIPDSKKVVIGIAVGHPDWEHPINRIVSEREPVENILTVLGAP